MRTFDPRESCWIHKFHTEPHHDHASYLGILLAAILLFACLPPTAAEGLVTAPPSVQKSGGADGAEDGLPAPRSDSIWMISTRCLGCRCGSKPAEQDFRFLRYDPRSRLRRHDWAEWSAEEQPGTTTVIYVHGNRVESDEVLGRGLAAYRALTRQRSGCAADPFRGLVVAQFQSARAPAATRRSSQSRPHRL